MDVVKQIDIFKEFLQTHYYAQLLDVTGRGQLSLKVDFAQLSKFSPELASLLLESPEELLRAFQHALEQFDIDLTQKDVDKFRFRFLNLPSKERIMIRNLRSKHLGKFIFIEGTVRQKSDVRPKVVNASFECPSCGNVIEKPQLDEKLQLPARCGKCGFKGKFRLLSKDLVDSQGMTLEEVTKELDGGEQPKRLKIFLKEDLVSPISDKKTNPGANIRIAGVLKEIEKIARDGGKLTTFDYIFEANSVESLSEDYTDIKISSEEEEQIKKLSQDPQIKEKLIQSVAPGIYGHDKVKEAIMLQFVGGVQKKRNDGVQNRGDIHILLIGDPGSGKSQLLKRASVLAPRGRYVSGKGASGAGLTASVVKDDFMGGWALEAGALVLANRGFAMIDELDKMTTEDRSAMHEALEQQTVTVSKANIQATLVCETTVLAAANPKMGRFDPFENLAKQINLPPALINRFDLIFPFRDIPSAEGDQKLASFVLDMHSIESPKEPPISTDNLRKYIIYARQSVRPKITEAANEEILNYYVKMRNSGSGEGSVSAISISARQLEALVRLTEASAKLRLSSKATKADALNAIALLEYCLTQIGIDPETGKIDIDRIQTGVTSSQRAKIINIREMIKDLEETEGKTIELQRLYDFAAQKGVEQEKVDEALEKLKMNGDLFEPKRGFISRIM